MRRQQRLQPQGLAARFGQHLLQLRGRRLIVVLHGQQTQSLAEDALGRRQRNDLAIGAAQLRVVAALSCLNQQYQRNQHQHAEHRHTHPHSRACAGAHVIAIGVDCGGMWWRAHVIPCQRKAPCIWSITQR